MAPSEHATRLAERLAERLDGVVALELTVLDTRDVAPGLRSLRLEGDLAGFDPWPGQDLMVSVPPGDAAARWRRYTVRRLDRAAGAVELWVTTTTDGPGATWAAAASPGDRVDAVGPRGKIALRADATDHLFVVDEAGLAACCSMAEAVEPPATVWTVTLLTPDPTWLPHEVGPEVRRGVTLRPHVLDPENVEWVASALGRTVSRLERATAAAYVFAELSIVRRAAATIAEHGLDDARVAAKPYWRDDRPNEANGEPDRTVAA